MGIFQTPKGTAMATKREMNALEKKNTQLSDQLARSDSRIRGLEKDLLDARKRIDHYRSLAAQNEAGRNDAEKQLKESKSRLRNDEPIGKGAFEVVTAKDNQMVLGRRRPKGTLLGFFTCIEGFEPRMVVDAVHYGTGVIQNADQHELYTELMNRADSTEKLAAAENRNAELERQLKELAADAGLGGDGENGGDENES